MEEDSLFAVTETVGAADDHTGTAEAYRSAQEFFQKNEQKAAARQKDLSGMRFGKLTALSATDKRADGGSVVWNCRCDCGKQKDVSSRRLLRGKVRSCGCLSNPEPKDYIGKRFGRLTVLALEGRVSPKKTELFWRCVCDCGNETTVGQTELQNGDTQSCGCLQRERSAENKQLIENTSVKVLETLKNRTRKDNKSGHTGVYQKKDGRWIAYINFRKKRYWLGCFQDKEEAIHARTRGEEMHDDFLSWYHTQEKKTAADGF